MLYDIILIAREGGAIHNSDSLHRGKPQTSVNSCWRCGMQHVRIIKLLLSTKNTKAFSGNFGGGPKQRDSLFTSLAQLDGVPVISRQECVCVMCVVLGYS